MIDLIDNFKKSNELAIITEQKSITYRDLNSYIEKFEKYFEASTISLIIGKNTLETICCYLASLRKSTTVLLLNENLQNNYIHNYQLKFKVKTIVSFKRLDFLTNIENITIIKDLYIYTLSGDYFKNKDLPSLLLTTSGSTGNPKVVKVSNENLISNTVSICDYLNIKSDSRHITTLPINYTYGLSCINTHLYSGAKIILNDYSILQSQFWKLFIKTLPTTFAGVPYTYEVLSRLDLKKLPFDSITVFTQAGGKLKNNLLKKYYEYCKNRNKEFIVMYGQTEATARMSYLPFKYLNTKLGSIGKAIPGGEFKLINTDRYKKVNEHIVGELIYKGDNVTPGYSDSYLNIEVDKNSSKILNTGDLAYIDKDDFIFISGRKKRFAKINGIRYSLEDIQEISDEIATTAVSSDDKLIYIYFESNNNQVKDISSQIKKYIQSKIKISPASLKVVTINKIPRSESGKILYSELLDKNVSK